MLSVKYTAPQTLLLLLLLLFFFCTFLPLRAYHATRDEILDIDDTVLLSDRLAKKQIGPELFATNAAAVLLSRPSPGAQLRREPLRRFRFEDLVNCNAQSR